MFDFAGNSSMHKRLEIWKGSLAILKDHWLFGVGLGKFQEIYLEYIPKVFTSPPLDWQVLHSHNLFFYFWLNLGIVGFLAFLGILVYLGFCFVKLAKDKKLFQKIRLEYFIFLGVITAIIVHGLFDTPYWKNDLAVLFWLVVGGVVWLCQKERVKN
ncbi:O-antigen ligase family protein [Patescibacteria group bacterium]